MHPEMADDIECLRNSPAGIAVTPMIPFVDRDLLYHESWDQKYAIFSLDPWKVLVPSEWRQAVSLGEYASVCVCVCVERENCGR